MYRWTLCSSLLMLQVPVFHGYEMGTFYQKHKRGLNKKDNVWCHVGNKGAISCFYR